MNLFQFSICAAAALALLHGTAQAQKGAQSGRLDEVVVEGQQPGGVAGAAQLRRDELRETLDDVPGATNLIEMEKLHGSQRTLAKVLDFEPGIIIQEFFGGNDQPRLNIRGSGIQDNPVNRGIQLLYDGLPLNQADGSFIIGLLDPEQAQFIAVYRGANAWRYGGTTLGGAIDFSLRSGANSENSINLEAGSWGLRKGAIALARQGEGWDVYLRASRYESDGWRSHSEAERSNLALNVGLNGRLENGLAWENRSYLNATDNRFEIPFLLTKERALSDPRSVIGDYSNSGQTGQNTIEDFLNVRTRDPWRDTRQLRLANKTTLYGTSSVQTLGLYAEKVRDEFKQPAALADTDAKNFGLDYALDYTRSTTRWGRSQYGLFVSANTGRMPRQWSLVHPNDGSIVRSFANVDQKASNVVIGGQLVQDIAPRWQAVAALQYAHHTREIEDRRAPGLLDSDLTYTALNPKLGVIFTPNERQRFFANISRSSEAPTFWQLADLGPGSVPASPASLYLMAKPLKMQSAVTLEIGTQSKGEFFSWEAAYFHSRVKDELIAEVQNFAIDGTTVNYDHDTWHQGVELGFSGRSRNGLFMPTGYLTYRGVYNWSDFKFKGGRYDGKRIAGVPVHLLTGELGYQFNPKLGISLNGRWMPQDTHVDHYNAGLKQDKYFLLGAKLTYRPSRTWELFVDLNNITGEKYQTAYVVRGLSAEDPASSLTAPTFVPGPDFHAAVGLTVRW